MDAFVVRTKKHYDGKAQTVQTKKERAQGPAAALKARHNAVKRALLSHFCAPHSSLLDIACGRGGDLHKWIDIGLARVRGYDVSEVELQEARRRLSALSPGPTEIDFFGTANLGTSVWVDEFAPYDAVSCMFALHYFWGSEDTAKALLQFVHANLRPGGVFLGIVPDARRLNAVLLETTAASGDTRPQWLPHLHLDAHWYGRPSPFGSAYTLAIEDTVTAGECPGDGSLEFLVYSSVLAKLAEATGFDVCIDFTCEGLDPDDAGAVFKHLVSPDGHPGTTTAAAFAFRKKDSQ